MHFLGGLEHVGRVLVVLLHFRTGVAHVRSLAAVKETVVETGHRCWNGGRRFGIGCESQSCHDLLERVFNGVKTGVVCAVAVVTALVTGVAAISAVASAALRIVGCSGSIIIDDAVVLVDKAIRRMRCFCFGGGGVVLEDVLRECSE